MFSVVDICHIERPVAANIRMETADDQQILRPIKQTRARD